MHKGILINSKQEIDTKKGLISMQKIEFENYQEFIKKHKCVTIEDAKLEIGKKWPVKEYHPKNFEIETTNVWSFPKRGEWATHYLNSKYRGNWAPQVVRNLLLRYTKEGNFVLDPFVGSGTTLIEAKILNRNAIGVDINYEAVILALDRLNFEMPHNLLEKNKKFNQVIEVYLGDARNLDKIKNESIDFIAAHPPYVDIIGYSKNSNFKPEGDLSKIHSVDEFCQEMKKVAQEMYRVLKPSKFCAILIGDTRRKKYHIPVSFKVLQVFLDVGFKLKEDIIKIQHRMKTTPLWAKRSKELNFLLLQYEHLFVFEK